MNGFLQRHAASVTGMLSGFDRIRFRGTIRLLANASGLAAVLSYLGVLLKDFKDYAMALSEQLKAASLAMAESAGRPVGTWPARWCARRTWPGRSRRRTASRRG